MIAQPMRVSGCAFTDCNGQLASVLELHLVTAGDGRLYTVQVPVCAVHGKGLREGPRPLFEFSRVSRAVVVEPELVVSDDPASDAKQRSRGWPTYQELVRAAMDRGGR